MLYLVNGYVCVVKNQKSKKIKSRKKYYHHHHPTINLHFLIHVICILDFSSEAFQIWLVVAGQIGFCAEKTMLNSFCNAFLFFLMIKGDQSIWEIYCIFSWYILTYTRVVSGLKWFWIFILLGMMMKIIIIIIFIIVATVVFYSQIFVNQENFPKLINTYKYRAHLFKVEVTCALLVLT